MARDGAIDIVLALVRARLGAGDAGAAAAPAPAPAEVSNPEDLVAVASAHFMLPVLGPMLRAGKVAIPADLAAFLDAMGASNQARNAVLRDALWRLAGRLNVIGVVPVVLKGGAFLADPASGNTAWRFMSDLDLLVDRAQLDDCVAVALAMGYVPVREDYDADQEAHYPPLMSPCGSFSIELHTRLFAVHEIGIASDAMAKEARLVEQQGARLQLPSATHRAVHLIAHAQIHNRFHMMERISLRDMLDLGALRAAHEGALDWQALLAAFAKGRDRDAARAFLCCWSRIAGVTPPVAIGDDHERWARRAIGRLSLPRWQRRVLDIADLIRAEAIRFAHERGHVGRRLALLAPDRFARAHATWRHKRAQKHWA